MKTHLLIFTLCCILCASLSCSNFHSTANGNIPQNIFAGASFSPGDPHFSYDNAAPLQPGQWNIDHQMPTGIHYPADAAPKGHQTADAIIVNVRLDLAAAVERCDRYYIFYRSAKN